MRGTWEGMSSPGARRAEQPHDLEVVRALEAQLSSDTFRGQKEVSREGPCCVL